MSAWIFGSFSPEIYEIFTRIAFRGTEIFSNLFIPYNFDSEANTLLFYKLSDTGKKVYITKMKVVQSCSGIKQIFQLLVIIAFAIGVWWKKIIYIISSIPIILFFNIIRISLLTVVLIYWEPQYKFIHDNIGRPFHYIIIFLIWAIWVFGINNKRKV